MTVTVEYRQSRRVLSAFRIREFHGRKVWKTEAAASFLPSEEKAEEQEDEHTDDLCDDVAGVLAEAASSGTEATAANAAFF